METKKFIACQNNRVLGFYETKEAADSAIENEKLRDRLQLLLKRRLLKKLLKSGTDVFTDIYYVAEVVSCDRQ